MPEFIVTAPNGQRLKITAPTIEDAAEAAESPEVLGAFGERLGIVGAAARGALVGAPEGLGALVDIAGRGAASLGIPGAAHLFEPLGESGRPGISFQEAGRRAGEAIAPEGEPGTVGEQRAFEVGRGATLGIPGGPIGMLASAAGDITTGELERSGAGLGLSVGGGAAVDIGLGLLARKPAQVLRGARKAFTEGAQEAGEAAARDLAGTARPRIGGARAKAVTAAAREGTKPGRRVRRTAGASLRSVREAAAAEPPVGVTKDFRVGPPADPNVLDVAGNIRMDNLSAVEDVKGVIRGTSEVFDGFQAARRGVVSDEEVARLAHEIGWDVDDLVARKGGAFLAEEMDRARTMLVASGNSVNDALQRIRGGDRGEDAVAAFREAWVKHVAIQETVAGATAEAGRTLRIIGKVKGLSDETKRAQRIIENGGGVEHILAVADLLEGLPTRGHAQRFLREAARIKTTAKLAEAWKAALLTGPQTHLVNIISNAAFQAQLFAEDVVAAGIRGLGGDRAAIRGLGGRVYGGLAGAAEGWVDAMHVIRTGDTLAMTRAMETSGDVVRRTGGAIGGRTGEVVRLPFRALGAMDALFRTTAKRSKLHQLAYEAAHRRGARGSELAAEAHRIIADAGSDSPSVLAREIAEEAETFGARSVFQRDLGDVGKKIQRGLAEHPTAQFVVPFLKTPTNIFKEALERLPVPVMKETRDAVTGKLGKRAQAEALSRFGMGSAMLATIGSGALEGRITGSAPRDERERAAWFASGKKPFSVLVPTPQGDRWVSYRRVEPLASVIGIMVDSTDLAKHMTPGEADNIASSIMFIAGENLLDKTYMQGVSAVVAALKEPDRYGAAFVENFVASTVGGAVSQAARAYDPVIRSTEGVLERVRSRVPIASTGLPPQIDPITGNPITRGGTGVLAVDFANPMFVSAPVDDPVINEMNRLKVGASRPGRTVGGERLDGETYAEYAALAGKFGYEEATRLVTGRRWAGFSDDTKRKALKRVYDRARAQARRNLGLSRR